LPCISADLTGDLLVVAFPRQVAFRPCVTLWSWHCDGFHGLGFLLIAVCIPFILTSILSFHFLHRLPSPLDMAAAALHHLSSVLFVCCLHDF
jgi:hypothetical protein